MKKNNIFSQIKIRFHELENCIQQPQTLENKALYLQYLKQYNILHKIVKRYQKWQQAQHNLLEIRQMIEEESDSELLSMMHEELEKLELEQQLSWQEIAATTKKKHHHNAIIEIHSGTGGAEACLFAQDLFAMYSKLAAQKQLQLEILSLHAADRGGLKEISFCVKGNEAYKHFRFEGGGHRVQRVPQTESGDRVHTSMCRIIVLPEVKEVQMKICHKDLKIEYMRASGAGGQHVNKTSSAVRLTHIPSGIVAICQETPSQHQNKIKAMKVLRARVYKHTKEKQQQKQDKIRDHQKSSGERNERIRTYNFPQSRVTDHRVAYSAHNLESVMQGNLDEFTCLLEYKEVEKYLQELVQK